MQCESQRSPEFRIWDHLVISVFLFHDLPPYDGDETFSLDRHLVVPILIDDRPFQDKV
jgi:hypothetical protein